MTRATVLCLLNGAQLSCPGAYKSLTLTLSRRARGTTESFFRLCDLGNREDRRISIDTLSSPQAKRWTQQTCGADLVVFIVTQHPAATLIVQHGHIGDYTRFQRAKLAFESEHARRIRGDHWNHLLQRQATGHH